MRFDGPNWAEVSASAKDLILRCLDKDAKRRITAEEALRHEWVREEGGAAQDVDIRPAVLDRLRAFAGLQKLKKLGRRARAQPRAPGPCCAVSPCVSALLLRGPSAPLA